MTHEEYEELVRQHRALGNKIATYHSTLIENGKQKITQQFNELFGENYSVSVTRDYHVKVTLVDPGMVIFRTNHPKINDHYVNATDKVINLKSTLQEVIEAVRDQIKWEFRLIDEADTRKRILNYRDVNPEDCDERLKAAIERWK